VPANKHPARIALHAGTRLRLSTPCNVEISASNGQHAPLALLLELHNAVDRGQNPVAEELVAPLSEGVAPYTPTSSMRRYLNGSVVSESRCGAASPWSPWPSRRRRPPPPRVAWPLRRSDGADRVAPRRCTSGSLVPMALPSSVAHATRGPSARIFSSAAVLSICFSPQECFESLIRSDCESRRQRRPCPSPSAGRALHRESAGCACARRK